MTELKVGDRVVVDLDYPNSSWHKAEGVVVGTRDYPNSAKVRVTKAGPNTDTVAGEERTLWNLTKIEGEPPFTFADIQVGDKIRRTLKRKNGSTHVSEGVVVSTDTLSAADSEGYKLAYASDGNPFKGTVVLELLERPKEPELWEDRKTGDKIVTYLSDGLDRIFTKREDGLWDTLVYTSGKKIGKGFPRADREIAAYLTKQTVTAHIVK